ncbi:hypothetical protein SODALDRAFT_334237 [Sodiomyces alkalinus F11]|uniref:Uncharacterized protein n=1 Tax=Sodiomyces alkalinus (strain CBS 110278 / VKM F-3762 / F11) TaxID=1314773 RepID=A0A3N2PRN9_SODAK|nr:hypothetical protein SODALDRAFT_334237 [Sodiomyces alkalinus F11]ROT37163.1 hypothetical protein SODALDRAFT_334237 [Sodiomyces alkalinus F11]
MLATPQPPLPSAALPSTATVSSPPGPRCCKLPPCRFPPHTRAFPRLTSQPSEHKRTAHNTPENIHPGTHYVCPVPGCHQGQLILRSDYPGPGRFDEFRRHFREDHPRLCDSLEPWVLDAIYASVRAQSDMSADTVNLERKTLEVREKVRKIREKEVEMDRLNVRIGQQEAELRWKDSQIRDLYLQVGLLRAAAGGFLGAGAPQAPM